MIRSRSVAAAHRNNRGPRRIANRAIRPSRFLTFLTSCLFAVASFAGGCAGSSDRNEQHFILEAVRQGGPVQPVADGSLEVHRFSIDAAFMTKNLVYRLGEFKYEADYYRQFLVPPGTMIADRTRDWLADSGLFRIVLPVGSRIVPTYTLEGNVTALYGDFADETAPSAVMEIRVFLLENAGGQEKVVFSETYRATAPVSSRATDDFIDALNRSLMEILIRLEADLQEVLVGRAPASSAPQSLQ